MRMQATGRGEGLSSTGSLHGPQVVLCDLVEQAEPRALFFATERAGRILSTGLLRGSQKFDQVVASGVQWRQVGLSIDLLEWLLHTWLPEVRVHGHIAIVGHSVQGHTVLLERVLGNLVPVMLAAAKTCR